MNPLGGQYATIGVRITADNRQLQSSLTQSTRSVQQLGSASQQAAAQTATGWGRANSTFGSVLSFVTRIGAAFTTILPIALSFGRVLSSGWERLTTLSNATRALTIQLGSAGRAAAAMKATLDVVTGTPYNFDQFSRITMNLVSFGVEVEKIPEHLTALAEIAATRGKEAGEIVERLAGYYGQMATSGTVTMKQIRGMEMAGVPALRVLANQLGVTTSRAAAMVSEGMVPAAQAMQLLSDGILNGTRGAAGATIAFQGTMEGLRQELTGAAGGLGAAMARFGANLWGPFEDALVAGFTKTSALLDSVGKSVGNGLRTFVSVAQEAAQRLQPVFQPLVATVGNFTSILGNLVTSATPVAKALAGLTGAVALPVLTALANVLQFISGVLSDYPWLVTAIAVAFASRLVPALERTVMQVTAFSTRFVAGARGVYASATSMNAALAFTSAAAENGVKGVNRLSASGLTLGTRLRSAVTGINGARLATIGYTAAVMAAVAALDAMRQKQDQAVSETQAAASEAGGLFDPQDLASSEKALASLNDQVTALLGTTGALNGSDGIFWFDSMANVTQQKQAVAIREEMTKVNEATANTTANLSYFAEQMGISWQDAYYLMQKNRIDLTMSRTSEAGAVALGEMSRAYDAFTAESGAALDYYSAVLGLTAEEVEDFEARITAAMDAARKGVEGVSNVLGRWKPNIGVQEEADALQALADARDDLANAESVTQIENALKRVAKAEEAVTEAAQLRASGTLQAYYTDATSRLTQFSKDLDAAINMGLDANLASRLIEIGPEQAAPILEQLVGDTTGSMIAMANEAEAVLSGLTNRIVEQQRLVALAVNAPSDELSKNLSTAMSIMSASWDGATTQDIAASLGLTEEKVREVAEAFQISLKEGFTGGISLSTASPSYVADVMGINTGAGRNAGASYAQGFVEDFQKELDAAPTPEIDVKVNLGTIPSTFAPQPYGLQRYLSQQSHAAGTARVLPGWTPGRDVHRFFSPTAGWLNLSGGEGIARPELVAAIGAGRWNALNALAASGGTRAVMRALHSNLGSYASGTARLSAIPVPVTSTHTTEAPMYVNTMYVQDPGEGRRVARRTRALNAIGGRRDD